MFNIDDSVLSLIPTIFDAKLCNYYIDGADLVIETKEEYLLRIDLEIRAPEALVTMLFPKTGYTSLGRYPIETRHAVLANYEGAYYTFVEGIQDANFIEKLLPNKVKTKHSVTGDGKVGTEVKLVNDLEVVPDKYYYGTNEDGQGRGYKPFPPVEDSLPDIVNNNYFITYMKNFMERCKQAYLVEPVNNTSISQVSTWSVEPYNFWIGLFKATVNISDLVDETITLLSTTYGYDTEGNFRELNSENITAAPATLILSINVNNLLTATLTGMSTNGKRILFCFERCCLYTRVRLIYGTSTDTATVEGILTARGLLQGESTDTATMEGLLMNKLTMVGESTDTATAEGTLSSKGNISGESTDTATTEGLLIAKGNMLGESVDTAEAIATLSAKGNMAGTSTDTATVTATTSNIHKYFIMGESIDRATATGKLTGYTIDKIRGASTDTATVNGNLINVTFCLVVDNGSIFTIKNIEGSSTGTSTTYGNLTSKPQTISISGTIDSSSSVLATSIDPDAFIFNVTVSNETVSLPLNSSYLFNFTIDWGDGSEIGLVTSTSDPDATHNYLAGSYTIKIKGTLQSWYGNNTGIVKKITKIINWGNCDFRQLRFYGANLLTSIPMRPITGVQNLLKFDWLFTNCTGLTTIPSDLFKFGTNVTSFSNTFGNSGLTSIPVDLFRYNTQVSSGAFVWTFVNCTSLTSPIPVDLFRYNTLASGNAFDNTFYNSRVTSIPVDLFRYNTQVGSGAFYNTFGANVSLTGSIPTDLFRYNTQVSGNAFKQTFAWCNSLSGNLPVDLFRYNTLVTANAFENTFLGTAITGAIPNNFFDYNTLVTTNAFSGTFQACSGLTGSIPTDLFRYNTQVSGAGFQSTFSGTGITSIPNNLFDYNTLVTTGAFNGTFAGCSGLTSIPTDLFRYNTQVSGNAFQSTFSGTGITSIPVDLFRYNTLVTTNGFLNTFYGCTNLASVPLNLFKYNVNSLSFNSTFYGCIRLVLNRNIFFEDGEEATRFLDKNINFGMCFYRTSYIGSQGEAPALWNCSFGTGTITKLTCYRGAGNNTTSLSNYASIPAQWL